MSVACSTGPGGPAVEGAALLVIDGRIAEVGRDDAVAQPEDARTLDLPGTTALPGLMDAHVHVTMPPTIDPLATMEAETDEDLVVRGSAASERMVRAGITTAFDCGARGMTAYAIRDGYRPRPRRSGRDCWSAAGRSPRRVATAISSAARPTASRACARRSAGCSRTRVRTGSRSWPPVAA